MRPTTAFDDNGFDINALLHPGTVFDRPRDVLAHHFLSVSEKRAILASWASDASAIASCPSLRAPAGLKAPVSLDENLEALCELTVDLATRRAASQIACDRRQGPWRRSTLNLLGAVADKNAGFKSLRETWADSTTPHGRLRLAVLGGLRVRTRADQDPHRRRQ